MCSFVDYCNRLISNVFISVYKKKKEEKYRPLSNSLNFYARQRQIRVFECRRKGKLLGWMSCVKAAILMSLALLKDSE